MKRIAKALLILTAVLSQTTSIAGTLGIHLGSWHDTADKNNKNFGLYYQNDSNFVFGAYHNSLRKSSTYAGCSFRYEPFTVVLGAITGYESITGSRFTPMLVPSVRFDAVRLSVVPKVGRFKSSVVHFSIEYKL